MTTAGCLARDDLRLLRGARTVENAGFDLTVRRRECADPIATARHDAQLVRGDHDLQPLSLSTATQDLAVGASVPATPGRVRLLWGSMTGVVGGIVGIAPHVLHHIGLLAGTAVLAGAGGTALFGAVGLLASVPMLLRLRRRFGTWRAPAIALGVFTAMFALSAFVIGPAISGSSASSSTNAPPTIVDDNSHHGD